MQSLFESKSNKEILDRINKLDENSQAKWGKMDVAQMLAHCSEPVKVPLEKLTLKKPNLIMKVLFSFFKDSLYNDKPWKHGLPTSKEYKIIDSKVFLEEKNNLIGLINELYSKKEQTNWPKHPFCGQLTSEQWGKMQYKHLDYHLNQFGV